MSGKQSNYVTLTGDDEDKRLELQNMALCSFDCEIYNRVFSLYDEPAILDIGCGTGNMIRTVLRDISAYRLIGIDEVERQIHLAEKSIPKGHFYSFDVEDEQFLSKIEDIMEENVIPGFDVINCSMVILHLKDPVNVLSKLHRLLSQKGTLIIRDIDDGIHFAWPDPEGLYKEYFGILKRDDRLGDRRCGRKIYNYLKKAGYQKIRIEKEGLSTVEIDDKAILYDVFVPPALHNLEQRHKEHPDNEQWKKDYYWLRDNVDGMKQLFFEDDFILSVGFMSYTAGKSGL